jgi:ubiquinone biosynthesis protein
MIRTLIVATRDRGRLAEITAVATRYGLGVLFARFGLDRPAASDEGALNEAGLPRRTRLALEELGPTFVKLGQILATRADLLPAEWIAELEQLHSQGPTLPFDALRMAVEAALGQPPEDAFLSFDPVPLAAASMAQVHRATLTDGRPIVLKIRRPDIRPRMEADLRLIAHLAAMVESASAEARRFSPSALVRQLAEAVLEELDFTNEGRNADRLRDDFANDPRVVIPTIHWQWSSEALLVMDYVDGIPPRNCDDLSRAGIDPAAIAELGADIVLDMVLINGRFHGDPHPGNLLCLPGNRIALLDMGMVGHVGLRRRQEILRFVQALSAGDAPALADIIAVWSAGGGATREQILRASERLVARHAGGALVLGAVIADFFPLLREERLVLPPDLLLIFKALVTIDGVLTGIVPGFDLSDAIARSKLRIMRDRLSPERWAPTVEALLIELVRVGDDAPRLLRAAVKRLEAEPATSGSDERLVTAVTSAGRWIAATIVLAAAMVAAAVIGA